MSYPEIFIHPVLFDFNKLSPNPLKEPSKPIAPVNPIDTDHLDIKKSLINIGQVLILLIIFLFIFLLLNSKLFGKSLGLHFILIMIVSFGGIIATSIILIIDIK